MTKRWLAALAALCIGTCAIGLAACGEDNGETPEDPATEHHFSADWSSNETYHWHACTDHSDCGQRYGYATHIYGDDDECDVCHYVKPAEHEHAWVVKFDENEHWQETSCTGHDVEKKDKAQHVFEEGVCSCGLKELYVDAYDVYCSNAEIKKETPLGFAAWYEALEEEGVTDLSYDANGDVVLHKGTETETGYFAARELTVQAAWGSENGLPVSGVWFKLEAVVGSEHILLSIAATPTGANGKAVISFVPAWGYSGDNVKYVIGIPTDEELTAMEKFPANPTDRVAVGEVTAEYAVTAESETDATDATFTFHPVLGLGILEQLARVQIGNGDSGETLFTVKLADGTHGRCLIEFSRMDGFVGNGQITVYVGDVGYDVYIVGNGDESKKGDESEAAVKTVIDIPEGTQEIKVKSAIGYERCADIRLTEAAALTSGRTASVVATPQGADTVAYDVTALPRGQYSVTAVMYGNLATSEEGDRIGAVTLKVGSRDVALTGGVTSASPNPYASSAATFTLEEGENTICFTGGRDLCHYTEVNLVYIEEVAENAPLAIDFANGDKIFSFTAEEDGVYELTVSSDAAFGGVTVKSASATLLNAAASQTTYTDVFKATAGQKFILTASHTGSGAPSVTLVIKKVEAGTDALTLDEDKAVSMAADVKLRTYRFNAEKAGYYTLLLSADASLSGLTVLDAAGEVLLSAEGNRAYLILSLDAGETAFTFLYKGEALALHAVITSKTAETLPVNGTAKSVNFTAAGEVAYLAIDCDSAEAAVTLSDDAPAKVYLAETGALLSFTNGTATSVPLTEGKATLIVIYEGDGAGSVTLTAKVALAAPELTGNNESPTLTWTAVENAEKYEIWLKSDEPEDEYHKVADVTVASLEGRSPSWDIPTTYWTAGYRAWQVKAVGEGFIDGVSNERGIPYLGDMVLIELTVQIAAEYPDNSLMLMINMDGSMKDRPYLSWTRGQAHEETFTYFLQKGAFSATVFGSLTGEFEATGGTIAENGYVDSKGATTLYIDEKGAIVNTKLTVTLNLPAGNASKEGDGCIDQATVELWKGETLIESKEVGSLSAKESETLVFDVLKKGSYTLKVTKLVGKDGGDVTQSFAAAEVPVSVEDATPVTATLAVTEPSASVNCTITVTITWPAESDAQAISFFIVYLKKDGAQKGLETATGLSGTSKTVTFSGITEKGEYTIELENLNEAYTAEPVTVTVDGDEASATVEIKKAGAEEVVNCTLTVTVNIPADNDLQGSSQKIFAVTLELWKDGAKYTKATGGGGMIMSFPDGKATVTYTVTEAGEYTVKVVSIMDMNYTTNDTFVTTEATVTVVGGMNDANAEITITRI